MFYKVVVAWHGVAVGQTVEIADLNPALLPNVELLKEPPRTPEKTVLSPDTVGTEKPQTKKPVAKAK